MRKEESYTDEKDRSCYFIDCATNPLDFRLKLDKIKAISEGTVEAAIVTQLSPRGKSDSDMKKERGQIEEEQKL